MGIVKPLFNEDPAGNPLDQVEVAPGIRLSRGLANFWTLIEKTRMPSINIKASPVNEAGTAKSHFAAYPTIPKGYEYPRSANGNFLFPLAQICCSELPPLAGYPDSGYLQFYINVVDDDLYGLDLENGMSQQGSRVLYFTEDEVRDPETNFDFLADVMSIDHPSPLYQPHILSFSSQDDYLGMHDLRYKEGWFSLVKNKYPDLYEQFEDELYEKFSCADHKIGGYAYFTQYDPRDPEDITRDFLLLFQMSGDTKIMWGDAGVGNFFISPRDLANKDFSRVLYNWDCG